MKASSDFPFCSAVAKGPVEDGRTAAVRANQAKKNLDSAIPGNKEEASRFC